MNTNDLLKEYTEKALRDFLKNDAENLLKYHPNEPTFSAKIAMYLHGYIVNAKDEFNGISVDCEYNKLKEDPKPSPNGYSRNSIRPDIIVHQRGNNDNNLLFCELKIKEISENDKEKVDFSLQQKLKYKLGLLIQNIKKDQMSICWVVLNNTDYKKTYKTIKLSEDESNG